MKRKICKECGEEKPLNRFHMNKTYKDGHINKCKNCVYEYDKKYRADNYDRKRCVKLQNRYGITLEQYDQMFDEQSGVCAICGNAEDVTDPRSGAVLRLSVDHNHETGKVRGLLCQRCNKGLGLFKDNTNSLLDAIKYLEREYEEEESCPSIRTVDKD